METTWGFRALGLKGGWGLGQESTRLTGLGIGKRMRSSMRFLKSRYTCASSQ